MLKKYKFNVSAQAAELYIVVLKSSAIFGHYLGDPHAVELIVMVLACV